MLAQLGQGGIFLSGFIAGCIAISLLWVRIAASRKVDRLNAEKERRAVVEDLGRAQADIDRLITAYNLGDVTRGSFKGSLSEGLERMNRMLKTSMNRMDAYHVKYFEGVTQQYWQLLLQAAPRPAVLTQEPEAPSVEPPPAPAPQPARQPTVVEQESPAPPVPVAPPVVAAQTAVASVAELEAGLETAVTQQIDGKFHELLMPARDQRPPAVPDAPSAPPQPRQAAETQAIQLEDLMPPPAPEPEVDIQQSAEPSFWEEPAPPEQPPAHDDAPAAPGQIVAQPAVTFEDLTVSAPASEEVSFEPTETPTVIMRKMPLGATKGAAPRSERSTEDIISGDDVADSLDAFFGFTK